ncbi:hypothetical protein ACLOJK_010189 [Asimina triloba]
MLEKYRKRGKLEERNIRKGGNRWKKKKTGEYRKRGILDTAHSIPLDFRLLKFSGEIGTQQQKLITNNNKGEVIEQARQRMARKKIGETKMRSSDRQE